MKKEGRDRLRGFIEIFAVIALFIFFAYLVQANYDYFQGLLGDKQGGMFYYFIISVVSILIAPISATPLLPVAANLWGWLKAAIISVVGWTIGAWLAFIIGRKYGIEIVKRFVSMEKIHKAEAKIPRDHLFWSVVIFRIILPTDILSYALGIFTKMKTSRYILATILGLIPFTFALAYLGTIPILYQVIVFVVGIIIIGILFLARYFIFSKNQNA